MQKGVNNLYTMTTISIANRILKFGLHIAVTWPGTPLPYLRKFCWLMALGVLQTYQYRYVIINFKSNTITEIIDNLSICMPFTLVFCKLCIAWSYSSLLSEIFSIMEEDNKKSAGTDTSNFILKALHLSYRMTSFVIYMFVSSAAFYMFGSLMSSNSNTITSRKFLLKMDLPFDTSESPIYELVVGVQFVYQGLTAYIFGVFTALLLMVVLHLGCQIDLMCQKLTDIPHKNRRHLKLFITRHQEIIIFANKMEKLFTYMALSQLLSNTLLICCLGYIIVLAIQMDRIVLLVKCLVFYISICIEVFTYCFAGEYLSIKSKLIYDTAYELLWYNIDPSDSQLLILVILRAQKGFTFTFGKFANLSMESFAAIMKASASYMSVLLAMT